MIRVYTQLEQGNRWLQQYQGRQPILACILGFTATALIPGISAAGATPEDRKYTAIADAEFLIKGVIPNPDYPLPPLTSGVSPVWISRAVVEAFSLPVYLFNAGLLQPPSVPAIDLGGVPANCVSTGDALPLPTVKHLFEQGLTWGEQLARAASDGYLIISECVVGGTTTALSILTGLGIAATGKVNSSHPECNHQQKWDVVQAGLRRWQQRWTEQEGVLPVGKLEPEVFYSTSLTAKNSLLFVNPLQLVAAVGDPMQIVAAGMTIGASRRCGVLLAGGTQMLAVYALIQALTSQSCSKQPSLDWQPAQVVVGTTRWVAEDPTGDTIGLAQEIGNVPLLATGLNFATSHYSQLQVYEQGYVKEGVGAGGCAIAAHLYQGWNCSQLVQAIECLIKSSCQQ